ncbi:MAG: EAL domain-containing protein [Agathobacter sp.]|nr:EAL domain-containing protein [Agathobacter sp.]
MKLGKKVQNAKKRILCVLIFFGMTLSMLPIYTGTFKADEKIIRIGYDANSNFIKEANGSYYGYGVEYLEKIAEYTGWKYEYVNDESWQASLDKLRNGQIDLICTAHYTEERAAEFLYSNIPLGYETSLLYAKPDSKIFYQDFEAMQGCKIGLLKESYSAQDFAAYALKQGIQYEGVFFERENDMIEALEKEKIDMMVIGSRYATSDLKLVDTSGANAFYCIAEDGNAALIEEIETVLQQIMFDEPTFEGSLNDKYFGHSAISNSPLYTKEELAYIESLGQLKIKFIQDQRPSCYIENGETKGIWAEVIALLSEKSGIDFVLEGGSAEEYSQEAYEKYLEEGYLLLRTQKALEHMNDLEGTITSNAITNVSVSYVKRQAAFVEDKYVSHVIATTKDLAYLEPLLLEENPDYEVKYFENTKECLEALIHKEAGMAIQNSHRTSYLMQKPEYAEKLAIVPGIDHGNDICLVAMEEQQLLIDIINKAIHHISYEEINEIVKRELLMNPYPLELDDIVYQSWEWMLGIGAVIVIAIIVYTVLTHRVAALKVQKKEYELLQKKVQLDEITGLYNRSYFYEVAKELIQKTDEEMCIITMDISNFKVVNELYGMNVGDRLLKEIAEQVQKLDKEHHMVPARFMADHYYMCMPKSEFDQIDFPKSFKTFLEDMDIRVVYGVFMVEDNKEMPINVMCDRAFIAAHDKNYKYVEYIHFYNDSERKQLMLEQEIEYEMEKALEECQFYIVVQPKYDPATEKIVGGETLVRWQHPEKGIISPGLFIKVFEKDGFIIQLDYFVWEETCRLQARMKQKGIKTVPISINVSRAHFYGSELLNKLRELIQKYNLDTSDIELEITESICGEDSGNIYDLIRELQKEGFKIAMDDFGSGYSSLNMLKEMPLDIIKMDLKFLDGEETKSRLILKALIEMAQTMELKVVVEGVEILSQVEFLRQFKDCYLQGYYFSRPVVAEVFKEMVENN